MKLTTSYHDDGPTCWCHPRVENLGSIMITTHYDLPEGVLAPRVVGMAGESDGDGAAGWTNRGPDESYGLEV